ncbi:MAG: S8 family serine peptidase [Oligoflexus sp.]
MPRLVFIFYLCFLGLACQEGKASKAEEENFVIKKDAAQAETQSLEKICQTAEGKFNQQKNSCDCGLTRTGQSRFLIPLFSQNGRGSDVIAYECREIPKFQATENNSWQSFQDIFVHEGKAALIQELQKIRYADNRRILQLHIHPDIRLAKLRELARKLDEDPFPLLIPNGYRRGDRFDIYYDYPEVATAHIRLAQQMPLHNFEDEDVNAPGRFFYAWNYDDLKKLMQTDSLAPELSKYSEETMLSETKSALQEIKVYWSGLSHQLLDLQENTVNIAAGCHEICQQTLSFQFADRHYWLERHFVRGHVVHQLLYSGAHDGSRKDAVFLLSDSLHISFGFIHKRRFLAGENNLLTHTTVFDGNGHKIQELAEKALQNAALVHENVSLLPSFPANLRQALVVFGQFNLADRRQSQRLLKGPFYQASPSEGGSLLGWKISQVDHLFSEIESYFDGVYQPWSSMTSTHTDLVLDELYPVNDSDAYVIPVGYPSLLDGSFRSILKASRSKLILLPATVPIQKEACEHQFQNLSQDVLWIMAAGNDGMENPKFRCPQLLGSPQNRIVVAASTAGGYQLDHRSDFGVKYADIAAPGIASNGHRGTSFAAPKIARVAAEILDRHPDLSAAEIRLAILLASSFDPQRPLAVRSGGSLQESWALVAAHELAKLPYQQRMLLVNGSQQDREDLYIKIISSFSELCRKDIKLQVQHLMKNGV